MNIVKKIRSLGKELTDKRIVEKIIMTLQEIFELKISSLKIQETCQRYVCKSWSMFCKHKSRGEPLDKKSRQKMHFKLGKLTTQEFEPTKRKEYYR